MNLFFILPFKSRSKAAFTLIELSITLVIIGLLAAGILTGRTLIRTAEINSVLKDLQTYKSAIAMFKDKFEALPGDFQGATSLWGANCLDPTDTNYPSYIYACDGNGDGTIAPSYFFKMVGNASWHLEDWQAWRHLMLAGLIPGRYTGNYNPALLPGYPREAGSNVGVASIKNAAWHFFLDATKGGGTLWFTNNYPASMNDNYIQPLTTTEAYAIDKKLDDGIPGTGKVTNDHGALCASGGVYVVTQPSYKCSLVFQP